MDESSSWTQLFFPSLNLSWKNSCFEWFWMNTYVYLNTFEFLVRKPFHFEVSSSLSEKVFHWIKLMKQFSGWNDICSREEINYQLGEFLFQEFALFDKYFPLQKYLIKNLTILFPRDRKETHNIFIFSFISDLVSLLLI